MLTKLRGGAHGERGREALRQAEAVAVGIERTVQMQDQVGYNASPINIILPWLKDLAACLRGGHINVGV